MSKRTYAAAMHAMQAGVAALMPSKDTEPKHLRVGINSALRDQGSLVKLLIAKGFITEAEYVEAITAGANEEADHYEKLVSEKVGMPVTLV